VVAWKARRSEEAEEVAGSLVRYRYSTQTLDVSPPGYGLSRLAPGAARTTPKFRAHHAPSAEDPSKPDRVQFVDNPLVIVRYRRSGKPLLRQVHRAGGRIGIVNIIHDLPTPVGLPRIDGQIFARLAQDLSSKSSLAASQRRPSASEPSGIYSNAARDAGPAAALARGVNPGRAQHGRHCKPRLAGEPAGAVHCCAQPQGQQRRAGAAGAMGTVPSGHTSNGRGAVSTGSGTDTPETRPPARPRRRGAAPQSDSLRVAPPSRAELPSELQAQGEAEYPFVRPRAGDFHKAAQRGNRSVGVQPHVGHVGAGVVEVGRSSPRWPTCRDLSAYLACLGQQVEPYHRPLAHNNAAGCVRQAEECALVPRPADQL